VHLRRLILVCFAVATACGGEDAGSADPTPEAPAAGGPAGHDGDMDPEALAAAEAKADGDPCAGYPGGTLDGADLLVLVNKAEGGQLSARYAPQDVLPLDPARTMPGRTVALRAAVGDAFARLVDAALTEQGFDLRARSGYRGYREQCFTFDYWVKQKGAGHADRYSARPGRSQHQLGTTVDITAEAWGWALEPEVATTSEAIWLAANAQRFGFALSYPEDAESVTGYGFEPWHFRYIGRAAADEMSSRDLLLETYLRRCAGDDPELECPREVFPALPVNFRFVGGACATDGECAAIGEGARCLLDGYAGGHCTAPCDRYCPDRPGNNTATFCVAGDDGAGLCHARCDFDRFEDRGCREGYVCGAAHRPRGPGAGEVCLPAE